jgi:predicted transport protein
MGNGNVEVGLERLEDLVYVIGLVRQALERQLGEEELEA